MPNDGTQQPLLTGLLDLSPHTNQKFNPPRKRFRHCRSAPLAEFVPGEVNGASVHPSAEVGDGRAGINFEPVFNSVHPSFRRVIVYLAFYLGLGTICFYLVRNQIEGKKIDGVLDSVYFCIVTMTTVGYGDLVPNSAATKLLACAFVFSGMALVGLVLSSAADCLVEKQEILLVRALHLNQKIGTFELLEEIETKKVRYKCIMVLVFLVLLMVLGTTFLAMVEKLGIVDAFYCVCSTITTLGYGDKSFSTKGGRIFAIFWIFISSICLAQFFLYIAEFNTERRQKALVNWVLTRKMTNTDLEEADIDEDGTVGAAEFVLYKLKEMGKINQDDISLLLLEFDNLDVDQSGTLSTSDLTLAQASPI